MVKFALSNYHKQTPTHWKAIGDTMLYSIPIIDSILLAMPEVSFKVWLIWGWAVFAAAVKIATKYIEDVRKEEDEYADQI